MIIGLKKLLQLVRTKKLVEGLSERELTNPEGAGFDLRLGEVYKIVGGNAFLGVDERETPKVKLIISYQKEKTKKTSFSSDTDRQQKIIIQPGEFYLVTTIEKLNLPENITVNFKPRTTTFRSGLFIRSGNVAPGYCGQITFAIKNEGPLPVTLEMGCRIIHAQFNWVDGGGNLYRGQWQGGRVTTKKREKQI